MESQFNPLKIINHLEKTRPVTCDLMISNLCNHNCKWCYYADYKKKVRKYIPRNILFKIIDELPYSGVKAVILSGAGEPLTHPNIKEALYKIKENDIEVGLVTNGSLLDKVFKPVINTCEWIRISLDATDEIEHKKFHGSNDFKKIIKNIKKLVRLRKGKKPLIGLTFTYDIWDLSFSSYEWEEEIKRLVKKLKVDYYKIRPIMDREDEYKRNYLTCRIHNFTFAIGPDCKVYPCCVLAGNRKFCYGDLRKEPLSLIWRGRHNVIKKINPKKCPPCRYDEYNSILEYLTGPRLHKNFL